MKEPNDSFRMVPPSPKLEDCIIKMKKRLLTEAGFPNFDDIDLIDLRSYNLIMERARATRDHDFAHSHAAEQAPVVGSRKAIALLVDFSDMAATPGALTTSQTLTPPLQTPN